MIVDREDTPANQQAWLEKRLEREARKRVMDEKGIAYKFQSPAHVSVPDRLICLPSRQPFFVEFKKWGAKPTDNQIREFKRLYRLGNLVYFIDNMIDFTTVVDSILCCTPVPPWYVSPPGEIYDRLWAELQEEK